jgi:hypothetical protein
MGEIRCIATDGANQKSCLDTGTAAMSDWAEIKRAFHNVGVDADTVMVGGRLLREKLDRLAAQRKPPTTKQIRDSLTDIIKKIDALRRDLDPEYLAALYAGDDDVAKACVCLDRIKLQLQRRLKASQFDEAADAPEQVQRGSEIVMEQRKRGNASKEEAHQYWALLTAIWQETILPKLTKRHGKIKGLVNFLEDCTGANREAIRSWLYRSGNL